MSTNNDILVQESVDPAIANRLLEAGPQRCCFCGKEITLQQGWCYFASPISLAFMCRYCEVLSSVFEPDGRAT